VPVFSSKPALKTPTSGYATAFRDLLKSVFLFPLTEDKKMKRSPLTHEGVFGEEDFAAGYARRHKKMAENFGREYAKKLSHRGFQKGRVIDVGCGFGGTAIVLAQKFPDSEIVGIDLSEPLLRRANQAAQVANLGERVRFEKADVQQIPYEDDSFDAVLNLNMVHLVKDPIKMLNEIERVLGPNGLLFVADIRRSWTGLFEREIKSALTLDEARDLFGQSELREGVFSSSLLWWRFEA
jgi:ubiquinone/menaquinone biosynthesis C-methylase UbiE